MEAASRAGEPREGPSGHESEAGSRAYSSKTSAPGPSLPSLGAGRDAGASPASPRLRGPQRLHRPRVMVAAPLAVGSLFLCVRAFAHRLTASDVATRPERDPGQSAEGGRGGTAWADVPCPGVVGKAVTPPGSAVAWLGDTGRPGRSADQGHRRAGSSRSAPRSARAGPLSLGDAPSLAAQGCPRCS